MCIKPYFVEHLFLSDLPSQFDDTCNPVSLYNKKGRPNCLLYTDDLVLLSTTEKGLQACSDKLHIGLYCLKWQLQINIKKSNITRQVKLLKETSKFQLKLCNV